MHTSGGRGQGGILGWAELDGKFSSMQMPTLHHIITATDIISCSDGVLCARVLYSK